MILTDSLSELRRHHGRLRVGVDMPLGLSAALAIV